MNLLHVRDADAFVESFTVGLTPKYVSDRAFRREVHEIVLHGGFSANALAAGFVRPKRVRNDGVKLPAVSWYWVPAAQLELGRVVDAGGNLQLLPLTGQRYVRLASRARVTIFPSAISEQLRVNADYWIRRDVEAAWWRTYFEGSLTHDIAFSGKAELTLLFRRGRKPPQFTDLTEVILGLGVRL